MALMARRDGSGVTEPHRLWCAIACGSSGKEKARTRRASVLPLIWQLDACAPRSARKWSAVGRVDVEGLHAGSGPDLAENRTPTSLRAY